MQPASQPASSSLVHAHRARGRAAGPAHGLGPGAHGLGVVLAGLARVWLEPGRASGIQLGERRLRCRGCPAGGTTAALRCAALAAQLGMLCSFGPGSHLRLGAAHTGQRYELGSFSKGPCSSQRSGGAQLCLTVEGADRCQGWQPKLAQTAGAHLAPIINVSAVHACNII